MMSGSVPIAVIRGGTSRGVFLRDADLPADLDGRRESILRLFGSAGGGLVDGLGGENPVLRKVAVVGPREATPDGTPVLDYTFGQVDSATTRVDHGNECGNIASGVPLFGALSEWCPPPSPGANVLVNLCNTGRRVRVEWIDGDEFGGSLRLWLLDPAAGGRHAAVALGEATTSIPCDPWGDVACSVLNAFNTHLFIDGSAVGLPDPLEPRDLTVETFAALVRLMKRVEDRLGMSRPLKVSLVGPLEASGPGLRARTVYPREARDHPSVAVTGAAALAVAACIQGSVVHGAVGRDPGRELTIRHPAGECVLTLTRAPEGLPSEVGIERSCRLILRGEAYLGTPAMPRRAGVV